MTTLIDLAAARPPEALVLANRRAALAARRDALEAELVVIRAAGEAFDGIIAHSPRPLSDVLAATATITRAVCQLDRRTGDVVGINRAVAAARMRPGLEGS
jgi:hypothetical protein